jgi:hypothetical protein
MLEHSGYLQTEIMVFNSSIVAQVVFAMAGRGLI